MNILIFTTVFAVLITSLVVRIASTSGSDFYIADHYDAYFSAKHTLYQSISEAEYEKIKSEPKPREPSEPKKTRPSKATGYVAQKRHPGSDRTKFNLSFLFEANPENRAICRQIFLKLYPSLEKQPDRLENLLNAMYEIGTTRAKKDLTTDFGDLLTLPDPEGQLLCDMLEGNMTPYHPLKDYMYLAPLKDPEPLYFRYTSKLLLEAVLPPNITEQLLGLEKQSEHKETPEHRLDRLLSFLSDEMKNQITRLFCFHFRKENNTTLKAKRNKNEQEESNQKEIVVSRTISKKP
ncbi:MAG: hypothetical protein K9M07_01990 [Simkaniaceae bacterium]|nr:hypothetical protein [Simkaniaceae bacterium]MCF7851992.1 hypothetical protein [Simkaniaceae bacterium]